MITLSSSQGSADVKLIATDAFGCSESSTQTVNVNKSILDFVLLERVKFVLAHLQPWLELVGNAASHNLENYDMIPFNGCVVIRK